MLNTNNALFLTAFMTDPYTITYFEWHLAISLTELVHVQQTDCDHQINEHMHACLYHRNEQLLKHSIYEQT